MSGATASTGRSAGLLAAALVASAVAVPLAAAGPASAACLEGVQFAISNHQRVFISVKGTRISFDKPGTHTVEITKASTLTARYNTGVVADQKAILAAVKEQFPRARGAVAVTTGHKVKFSSDKGEKVTVSFATRGDRVKWTKLDVKSNCSSTVLDSGFAKFPRRNLDWLFAVAIS